MGDNNDGIKVNFGKSPSPEETEAIDSKKTEAVDEWEKEIEGGGGATTIDSEALQKLRNTGGLKAVSVEDTSLDGAAEEFDIAPATVMEDVEELSGAELLQAVDSGELGGGENTDFDEDSKTRMDPRVIPEAEVALDVGKKPCPKCGVMVASGYPKCPRCKHSLVKKRRATTDAGGTSLRGRAVPWSIVFIVAVLTAIIVYLAEREPVIESDADQEAESASESAKPASE